MTSMTILVVEDQPETRHLIQAHLENVSFTVICTSNGSIATELIHMEKPDLMILDAVLPDMDGYDLCRRVRQTSTVPIVFISSKTEVYDKVLALELGGDDYLTKPFHPSELVARVQAILRRCRTNGFPDRSTSLLTYPGLTIDLARHVVHVNGSSVSLATKEFLLLVHLARHPGQIYSLDDLYEIVWGADSMSDTRTVMVHIRYLRKKIEMDPSHPQYIQTVRNAGYKFNMDFPTPNPLHELNGTPSPPSH